MNRAIVATVAAAAVLLALSACTSGPTSAPIKPSASTSASAQPTEAEGSRANPLAIGREAKYSDKSMWKIGASGATLVRQGYIELPLHLGIDWDACREYSGAEQCEAGTSPAASLAVSYVAADGSSYSSADDASIDWLSVPALLSGADDVYPPLAEMSTSVIVSVPADKIAGGVWRIASQVASGVIFVESGL
ncbi:hypothetical protein GCM10027515_09730 [Schumannella luteola]|uniref:DUF4352 domain-containing protein n=1 Tax=Schumannella luteola TaxID=472059 RepID=A0A852Y866_9MICO|nr:hypothetical protein [Schumannella luteola]NYG97421.1 hypothetical protein [Schumannella luteola]TPX01665.1 hypothetical protein FJ656_26510 [Schumannella luteola]